MFFKAAAAIIVLATQIAPNAARTYPYSLFAYPGTTYSGTPEIYSETLTTTCQCKPLNSVSNKLYSYLFDAKANATDNPDVTLNFYDDTSSDCDEHLNTRPPRTYPQSRTSRSRPLDQITRRKMFFKAAAAIIVLATQIAPNAARTYPYSLFAYSGTTYSGTREIYSETLTTTCQCKSLYSVSNKLSSYLFDAKANATDSPGLTLTFYDGAGCKTALTKSKSLMLRCARAVLTL
ncbi:hypothetical protein BV22DRAFT_1048433 [Leucogyrophana mollusca]|uniref:Uncharacterized protein n=1 Tax=Leucogyrophana mollusca TaxID=85980 RepID=A0ACB8BCN1_9AGAM|nr:hypothetical protein BV22DRAFT_1048433 [Leucogyrophana mollusca]